MAREQKPIRSAIAWSDADHIVVRGLDVPTEILGHLGLGEVSFLQLTGRRPSSNIAGSVTSPGSLPPAPSWSSTTPR